LLCPAPQTQHSVYSVGLIIIIIIIISFR